MPRSHDSDGGEGFSCAAPGSATGGCGRRQRFIELRKQAHELGITDDDLSAAMGLAKITFDRIKQDARGKKNTKSVAQFLNNKLLDRLHSIVALVRDSINRDRERRFTPTTEYVTVTERQLTQLRRVDEHWLVTIIPPMECLLPNFAEIVVTGVLRGARYNYLLPSDRARNSAFPGVFAATSRSRNAVSKVVDWDGKFATLPSALKIAKDLHHSLIAAWKNIAEECKTGERQKKPGEATSYEQLVQNVSVQVLDWCPIIFNEKISWTSDGDERRRGTIKKQILLSADETPALQLYSGSAKWITIEMDLAQSCYEHIAATTPSEICAWPTIDEVRNNAV